MRIRERCIQVNIRRLARVNGHDTDEEKRDDFVHPNGTLERNADKRGERAAMRDRQKHQAEQGRQRLAHRTRRAVHVLIWCQRGSLGVSKAGWLGVPTWGERPAFRAAHSWP